MATDNIPVSRKSGDQIFGLFTYLTEQCNELFNRHGLSEHFDGEVGEGAKQQLYLDVQNYNEQLAVLDQARRSHDDGRFANLFSDKTNNYLYYSSINDLMADHRSRVDAIRRHLNETANNYNKDLKRRLEAAFNSGALSGEQKEMLRQEINGLQEEQNKMINGDEFDAWAQDEESALLARHFKHSYGVMSFRPKGDQRKETLIGTDLEETKKIAVDLGDRRDFAEITVDKKGNRSLNVTFEYFEHGDYIMFWKWFHKPGAGNHMQTFQRSPWHSPWRDAAGQQLLGGLEKGDQLNAFVDLYEQTFKDTPNLKNREVKLQFQDYRLVKACAIAFIRRGYRIDQSSYDQSREKPMPAMFKKELREFEDKVHREIAEKLDKSSRHNIGGAEQATVDQQAIQAVLGDEGAAGVPPPAI